MKFLLVVLAAVTLNLRYPCWQPASNDSCGRDSTIVPEQLADLILRDEGGTELYRRAVSGHECQWDTLTVVWDGSPVQRFLTVTDLAGNESCRTGRALGEWPVSVPPASTSVVLRREFFDVSGRRVDKLVPGRAVYFERVTTSSGQRVRRIVIVKGK